MENFEFYSPTRIIFGKDTENQVGSLAKAYSKKVLLHYGGSSIKKSGLYDRVVKSLKDQGIEIVELGGVVQIQIKPCKRRH
jgi:alcohol dehydrogenase YqhD (iron-dependent ADH family)